MPTKLRGARGSQGAQWAGRTTHEEATRLGVLTTITEELVKRGSHRHDAAALTNSISAVNRSSDPDITVHCHSRKAALVVATAMCHKSGEGQVRWDDSSEQFGDQYGEWHCRVWALHNGDYRVLHDEPDRSV